MEHREAVEVIRGGIRGTRKGESGVRGSFSGGGVVRLEETSSISVLRSRSVYEFR